MSIQALNWVMEQDSIENSGAKFVLMILCNYADERGGCYPSRETIAAKTGFSLRAVQNHLNWLVENNFIEKTNRRIDGHQSSNFYNILFDDSVRQNATKQSAESALCDKSRVQKTTEQGAKNDILQGAESAPNTKEVKDEPKEKKHTHSAQVRETKPVCVTSASNIPNEIIPTANSPDEQKFWDGLSEKLLVTPFEFPKWETVRVFAVKHKISTEKVLACIDYLQTQDWRKSRITPEIVANNLGQFIHEKKSSYVNPTTGKGLK